MAGAFLTRNEGFVMHNRIDIGPQTQPSNRTKRFGERLRASLKERSRNARGSLRNAKSTGLRELEEQSTINRSSGAERWDQASPLNRFGQHRRLGPKWTSNAIGDAAVRQKF